MPVFGSTRLLGFVLLAVSFGVGALAGAAVERVWDAERTPTADDRADRGDRRDRSHIIDRIDMTPGQRQAIDAILERRSKRMRAVWQEVEPRMKAITDSVRTEIMDVLTPEQRTEYEERLEAWHDRRMRNGKAPAPPVDKGADAAPARDSADTP